jgi:mannose-1-phosphate guanylyltransferase
VRKRPRRSELSAALIIAGGLGTRFWPASRKNAPKPLFSLNGKTTLLADTIYRHRGLIPPRRIFVLVSAGQASPFRRQLDGVIPPDNLIVEPEGRGTAVAIAYGAGVIRSRVGEVEFVVAPADHHVAPVAGYHRTLSKALMLARTRDAIVVIGIAPTRADSGYGYQQIGRKVDGGFKVARFIEKPAASAASDMLKSGKFLWNSGVFIMSTATLESELLEHCPALGEMMRNAATARPRTIERDYQRLRFPSFDYAVVEKSKRVLGLRAEYQWHDVGSWEGLCEALSGRDGNAVSGQVLTLDSKGVLARSSGRLMVLLGVQDLVAVDTGDVVLIAKRSRSQEIRNVIDELKRRRLSNYL